MKTWKINQFYGGFAIDDKLGTSQQFGDGSEGVDTYHKPSVLRGNLKMETHETGAVDARMQDFTKGSDGTVYGYGYIAYGGANIRTRLWKLASGTWSAVGSATSGSTIEDGQIIEYKDHILGYSKTNKIFTYGLLSGTPSFTEDFVTTTNSIAAYAPMAVQQNTLYIANENLVASLTDPTSSASFTASAFDLPDGWTIVTMVPWGKYLAIGATSPEDSKVSKIFFWDTSSESYEFAKNVPQGKLIGIVNIGDILRGVVLNSATAVNHIGTLNIIEWNGGAVNVVWTQKLKGLTSATTNFRNNGLDEKDGTLYIGGVLDSVIGKGGIYTYGQPIIGGTFSFNHSISVVATLLEHFHCLKWIGTFLYASFLDNTSTDYKIVRSDDTDDAYEDFTYESLIFDGGKIYKTKAIQRIIVNTNALPANAVVTLKYKVDRASSWTTVGTISTTSATQKTFQNISGSAFNNFSELQLQLSSNMSTGDGLIEVTGITVLYEELAIPA